MNAILDHVAIAVREPGDAVAFFRDALGLEVGAPVEAAPLGTRTRNVPAGTASLELLEAAAPDSAIGRFIESSGPGLHHVALRVEDLAGILARLENHGARLFHQGRGADGSEIAFVHPSGAPGLLVELTQAVPRADARARGPAWPGPRRITVGDLELISLCDGFFSLDGGAMFGVVPKTLWEPRAPADGRNRIRLAMRPLVVRGSRTVLVDAGVGDKTPPRQTEIYHLERARHLDHSLAEAGLSPDDIDIVLATHLHFDHAGGFTARDGAGRLRPRFPRAEYLVRRGEWDDAVAPNERNRASYLAENLAPLAEAGALRLLEDDAVIMPGLRVQRTGGHTAHHQIAVIESGGRTAVVAADLVPTVAHLPDAWIMGYDLYPLDTLRFKRALLREVVDRGHLMFFAHDPSIAAAYVRERDGKRSIDPVL